MGKRYAYLEFQHKGIVPPGHNKTYLTGHDVLALMYRVEQRIKAERKEKGKEKEKEEKVKPEESSE